MRLRIKNIIIGIFLPSILISCSSILNGVQQSINFTSNPSGAKVNIDGVYRGVTPISIDLSRNGRNKKKSSKDKISYDIKLELEGYTPYHTTIKREFSGIYLTNLSLVTLAPVGILIDANNGSMYDLTPEDVNAHLIKFSDVIYDSVPEVILKNSDSLNLERPHNSIYFTYFGGDLSAISFNYERQFFINDTFFLTTKLGLGTNLEFRYCLSNNCSNDLDMVFTVPYHFTANTGNGKHFFELGLGGSFLYGDVSENYILCGIAGYRFLPLKSNKVNMRLFGSLPFSTADNSNEDYINLPIGISIGISF